MGRMSVLGKKLHVIKTGGADEAISLYTTTEECGEPNLKLQVDGTMVYAKMGSVTESNASSLRVYQDSDQTTYAVLKETEEVTRFNFWIHTNGAVTLIEASEVETLSNTLFCQNDVINVVEFPSCLTVKDGDLSWGEVSNGAFYFCKNLQRAALLRAKDIGAGAFFYCSSLTDVSLDSAINVGYQSFRGCSSLQQLVLPRVVRIGAGAFAECPALTKIFMPYAEEIGDAIFYSCSALTEVYMMSAINIGASAFSGWTGVVHFSSDNEETIRNLAGFDSGFNGTVEILFDL